MVEVTALIVLLVAFLGVLMYLYFHTREQNRYIDHVHQSLTRLPAEMQQFFADLQSKSDKRAENLVQETFRDCLKHIEKLERMTLPKPVSVKEVQEVIDRTGPVIENDIEKVGEEGVSLDHGLSAIPFGNPNLKTVFEDEVNDLPTEIEDA